MSDYDNGPLPAALEQVAYFTPDRREWALPKSAALEYLDWCERMRLNVLGWEAWYATSDGPTVIPGYVFTQEGVQANRETLLKQPERDMNGQLVFNITVARRKG